MKLLCLALLALYLVTGEIRMVGLALYGLLALLILAVNVIVIAEDRQKVNLN